MKRIAHFSTLFLLVVGLSQAKAHAETITFDGNDVESSGVFMVTGEGAYQIGDLNGLFNSDVLSWCAQACDGLQIITLKRPSGTAFGLTSVDGHPAGLANIKLFGDHRAG